MSMNEKTFQQILSLHAKGLGDDASLLGILQLIYGHSDHRETVKWIKRFYQFIKVPNSDDRTREMVAVDALKSVGVDPVIAVNIVSTKGRVLDFTETLKHSDDIPLAIMNEGKV